jgi:hypothetical protein
MNPETRKFLTDELAATQQHAAIVAEKAFFAKSNSEKNQLFQEWDRAMRCAEILRRRLVVSI